jgi:hypothetical protein
LIKSRRYLSLLLCENRNSSVITMLNWFYQLIYTSNCFFRYKRKQSWFKEEIELRYAQFQNRSKKGMIAPSFPNHNQRSRGQPN